MRAILHAYLSRQDLMIDDTTHRNALAAETSPYLLQHAHNPVDWYAWSEAALDTARREDKPILQSIKYSTCHWCHVMAHESFEDAKTTTKKKTQNNNNKNKHKKRPNHNKMDQ